MLQYSGDRPRVRSAVKNDRVYPWVRQRDMIKTLFQKKNGVKLYGVITGPVMLLLQYGIYLIANAIAQRVGGTPYVPKLAVDGLIPLIPVFIIPYYWSYAFWAMGPMAVSKCESGHFLDYLASYLFTCLISAVIIVFAPTCMDRVAEGLYDLPTEGALWWLLRFCYDHDGGPMAYNLLPSFHCINSVTAFLGVMGRDEVPLWYRIYSCAMMLVIFASTLFIKQHFVLDVIVSIILACAVFLLCKRFHAGNIFLRPFSAVMRKCGTDKTDV